MDESVAFHIEEYFFIDRIDRIIKKLPAITRTTLFSSRFTNFPFVDFIIVNVFAECHLFQVTVNIEGHSKSAEQFASKYLEIFKANGIKKFFFYYMGVGKSIPDRDSQLLKDYERVSVVPFQYCHGVVFEDICISNYWDSFMVGHKLNHFYVELSLKAHSVVDGKDPLNLPSKRLRDK